MSLDGAERPVHGDNCHQIHCNSCKFFDEWSIQSLRHWFDVLILCRCAVISRESDSWQMVLGCSSLIATDRNDLARWQQISRKDFVKKKNKNKEMNRKSRSQWMQYIHHNEPFWAQVEGGRACQPPQINNPQILETSWFQWAPFNSTWRYSFRNISKCTKYYNIKKKKKVEILAENDTNRQKSFI